VLVGGAVQHSATGIAGLDEITLGGLPRGRTTLVSGGPGCGKTLLGTAFLVNGIAAGDNGVFIAFEERPEDLAANAASLGFDLDALIAAGKLELDYIEIDRDHIHQTATTTWRRCSSGWTWRCGTSVRSES
jgi:circadian clock protein KaiC